MKLSNTLIWIWDDYLSDPEIQEAIKGFGGIYANSSNGQSLAETYPHLKNLYNIGQTPTNADSVYIGEYGTRRLLFPDLNGIIAYADESSPYRLDKTSQLPISNLGYSSYRTTLFTIPTKDSDINIRIPILSPIWTLKRLNNKYGTRHRFVWLDLKKSLHFCYPWKMFIDLNDKKKSIDFNPFMKIPFQWHIRRMIRFADKYGKRLFIYAGDYDVSKEEVLKNIAIIKKYLEV